MGRAATGGPAAKDALLCGGFRVIGPTKTPRPEGPCQFETLPASGRHPAHLPRGPGCMHEHAGRVIRGMARDRPLRAKRPHAACAPVGLRRFGSTKDDASNVANCGSKRAGHLLSPRRRNAAKGTRAPLAGAAPFAASGEWDAKGRTAAGVSAPCRAPAFPGPDRARAAGAVPDGQQQCAPWLTTAPRLACDGRRWLLGVPGVRRAQDAGHSTNTR